MKITADKKTLNNPDHDGEFQLKDGDKVKLTNIEYFDPNDSDVYNSKRIPQYKNLRLIGNCNVDDSKDDEVSTAEIHYILASSGNDWVLVSDHELDSQFEKSEPGAESKPDEV